MSRAFFPVEGGVRVSLGSQERRAIGLALSVVAGYHADPGDPATIRPVSYTHLTLPTN